MNGEQLQGLINSALAEYIELIYNNITDDNEASKRAELLKNYTTYLEQKIFKY